MHTQEHSHRELVEGKDIWKTPFRSNETGVFLSSERQIRGPFTLLRDSDWKQPRRKKEMEEKRQNRNVILVFITPATEAAIGPLGPSLVAKAQNTY